MSRSRKVVIVLLACSILCVTAWIPPASAEDSAEESGSYSTGTRVGAYAVTPFYFVGKVLYAGAGASGASHIALRRLVRKNTNGQGRAISPSSRKFDGLKSSL